METPDLPIEFYKTWSYISGALITMLLAVIAFYIRAGFTKQEKKDEEQDEEIDKISLTLEAMRDVATSMRLMIQKHDSEISFLMKNVEKATKR